MGATLRHAARRVCFGLAAAFLAAAAFSPTAGAAPALVDDVPKPDVWVGDAESLAVSVELNREALLPIPDMFKFIALDGMSTYGSSNQAGRASIVFPGNGAILGPGLACGTFGAQFPPEFKPILDTCLKYQYPLTVYADEFDNDASTVGSIALGKATDDISVSAATARAHAAVDGSNTDAVVQDLRVLGVPPFGPLALPGSEPLMLDTSIVDIDSATSRTDQRIVKGGLVTTAKATLSGVKLIGGLIRIGSLVSESTITDAADGKRTADANFRATGVTVAGQPAQITNKGLVLGSSTTPIPPALLDGINSVLDALNVKLSALPTEETLDKNGQARANVGGLIFEFQREVQGLPLLPENPITGGEVDANGVYTLTVQLGLTGAVGSAASFGSDGDVLDEVTDDLGGFSEVVGDFGFDDSGSFDDGGFDGTGALGDGPSIIGGGRGATDENRVLVRSISDNFGDRLGFLYLALMFAVLALCIAPVVAVPARIPKNV